MVTLHQLPGEWGLSSVSPFCIKLEAYLRMAGVPFENAFGDPRKAPRKKVPWIVDGGRTIADTRLIIDYLKKTYGDPLDARLDAPTKSRGHALTRMLEEATYFAMVHVRWADDAGWAEYKKFFRPFLPPVVGAPILGMIRRDMMALLHAQGSGRHAPEDLYEIAAADFEAVSAELGDKPYLFGDEPTSYDATAYGFVASVLGFPVDSALKRRVAAFANLVAYRARVESRYFAA
jgi:glutathione S-transferase